jgi:hypothetical protein
VTVLEELDDEGVADTLLVDCVGEVPTLALVELELVDDVCVVADAAAPLVPPAAITVTRPLNATPDTTAAAHRARAAG